MYHHQPLLEAQYSITQGCCRTTICYLMCSRKHPPPLIFINNNNKEIFLWGSNSTGKKREKPVAHISQALLPRSSIFHHRPFKIHFCSSVASVLCDAGIGQPRFTRRHKPAYTLESHAITGTQVKHCHAALFPVIQKNFCRKVSSPYVKTLERTPSKMGIFIPAARPSVLSKQVLQLWGTWTRGVHLLLLCKQNKAERTYY